MSLVKHSVTLVFWTILSRVTGFLRDSIMAKYLGSSMMSDVIVAATKIPNSFRRLLGEGAMSSVFVPMFSKLLAANRIREARFFASQIFTYLAIFLIVLTIICEIFMPEIVGFVSFGFKSNPAKFNLTIELARINFIYLITICLTSLCGGILNSIGKFAFFAATPIVFNLGLVLVFLFAKDFEKIGYLYSYSCVAIGFVQLISLFLACRFYKFKIGINISQRKGEFGIGMFLKKIANGFIGSGIYQVNILVDSIFASMFAGGVSYLYYTDRLSQLPLTLIGGTMAVSLLPILSKNVKLGDQREINKIHSQSILFAVFAIALCLAIIFSSSFEMVAFVYGRGEFLDSDVLIVARLLEIFALGFIFTIFSKIYNTFLFANLDTKTPMLIGLFSMIINVIFNALLYKRFGYFCVAYASTISAFGSGILSMYIAFHRGFVRFDFNIIPKLFRVIFIGFLIYFLQKFLIKTVYDFTKINSLSLLISIGISSSVYVGLIILLKVYTLGDLLVVFKRRRK